MTPTAEQQAILDGFKNTTGNIKVLALAGTGKTSTLLELVKQNPSQTFLYLAFNRDVKEEVERKALLNGLDNLRVKTQNGFCLQLARDAGMTCRNIRGYMSVKDTISRLRLTGTDKFLAYNAFQIMTAFMISRETEMKLWQVPKSVEDKIHTTIRRSFGKDYSEERLLKETDKRKKRAFAIAKELFESFDFHSDIMLHDVYVKLVQLHFDKIPVAEDVVLSDESQDVNPVFSDIISRMTARIIAVGDSNQEIYGFRGAENYLDEMPAEAEFTLTQSFRFLPEIAETANELLEHMTDLRLKGFEKVENDDSSAILCRSNMGCLNEAIKMLETNTEFALEGGVDNEGFKMIEDIIHLNNGDIREIKHPDLKGLKSIQQFYQELQDDLLNHEWRFALRIIEKMGGTHQALRMIGLLKNSQKNVKEDAVVITTMHKSKGKEWNHVKIGSDAENVFYQIAEDFDGTKYRMPIEFKDAPRPEKNLLYVAVTRAKKDLDVGTCDRLFKPKTTEAEWSPFSHTSPIIKVRGFSLPNLISTSQKTHTY